MIPGGEHGPVLANHDVGDVSVIDEAEPPRVVALHVAEHLLGQQAAVRAALDVGQHRAVAIVIDLEDLADRRLGNDLVETVELGRQIVEKLRRLGDATPLGPPATLPPDEVAAEMDLEVMEVERPMWPSNRSKRPYAPDSAIRRSNRSWAASNPRCASTAG